MPRSATNGMKVSYKWLQTYFTEDLPKADDLADLLTFHSFEIEEIIKFEDDAVIDVDVLPNRSSDCLSQRGIAREIATLTGLHFNDPLKSELKKYSDSRVLSVDIKEEFLCKRFTGAVINNIKVGPSPSWLVERLKAIGQKSVNNIVDATNYVMFGMGQPIHAFDMAKLRELEGKRSIHIRLGKRAGENITTLDGVKYDVGENNLLIVDGNCDTPIAIAGIKGGKMAEVTASTTDIILESANFDFVSVRKSAKELRLQTDASLRFQNEPSPELARFGLQEVISLITDLSKGQLEGIVDSYPRKRSPQKVGVSVSEINSRLGTGLSETEVEDILKKFDFVYEKVRPIEKVLELAPTFEGRTYSYGASVSFDAPVAFDCSGLVQYLFREAGISIPRVSVDQFVFGTSVDKSELKQGDVVFANVHDDGEKETFTRIKDGKKISQSIVHKKTLEYMPGTLVEEGVDHCGLYIGDGNVIHATDENKEVVIEKLEKSSKFTNIVGYRRMIDDDGKRYVVTSPFERTDLKIREDLIEEVGRVYGYDNIKSTLLNPLKDKIQPTKKFFYSEKIRKLLVGMGFSEVFTYTFTSEGEVEIENPLADDKKFMRSNLSAEIEKSLVFNARNAPLLGLTNVKIFEIGAVFGRDDFEHTALALGIAGGLKNVGPGVLEKVLDAVTVELDIDIKWKKKDEGSGHIAEVNLDDVIGVLPQPREYDKSEVSPEIKYRPFSRYPFALRDIALWVKRDAKEEDVMKVISDSAGNLLVGISLFDEFRQEDRISYAYHLVFQSYEKTLSDAEVNEMMENIAVEIKSRQWEIR